MVSSGMETDGSTVSLKSSRAFSTLGFGGVTRGASTRDGGSGIDGLASQNPVIVSDTKLFAVNAGSDTVALFLINKDNPLELIHASTFPSGGDFPVVLAFSKVLKLLCVGNGGRNNNIQCFRVSTQPTTIVKLPQGRQSLELPLSNPPDFPDSISDLQFSPDSTQLFLAIKGNEGRLHCHFPRGQKPAVSWSIHPTQWWDYTFWFQHYTRIRI